MKIEVSVDNLALYISLGTSAFLGFTAEPFWLVLSVALALLCIQIVAMPNQLGGETFYTKPVLFKYSIKDIVEQYPTNCLILTIFYFLGSGASFLVGLLQ